MTALRALWAAVGIMALGGGVGPQPVFAHHSFALYDMARSVEIDGSVDRMEWSNPHCWLFIWVGGGAEGTKVSYGFEMTSVGEMTRRGWKKTAVKPGDKIKVKYHPLRDGRNGGLMLAVMTADGQTIGRAPGAQNPSDTPPQPADANN
jgi:Family of unknown function (DUF6152)